MSQYGQGQYGWQQYGRGGTSDQLGPLVTPVDPTNGDSDVDRDTDLTIQIEDSSGIALGSIRVEVDPDLGFEDAFVYGETPQFKPGWDGSNSDVSMVGNVLTIVIDREEGYRSGTTVQTRVTARDIYGNPARLS